MNEFLQLGLALTILIASTAVVVRYLIKRHQAQCSGTCVTCPSGNSETGTGACERATPSDPDLTQIRSLNKE